MPPPNRRPGFSRRAQYSVFLGYVVAGAGVLFGLVLLLLSVFDPVAFRVARGTIAEVTTPISSGAAGAGRWVADIPDAIGSYFGVRSENARLRAELYRQREWVQQARTLSYDNRRLRRLLRLREGTTETVVAARLVNSSAASTRRFATLNAGAWQGVATGQPVRGPDGLVGRTISVSPNTARVMLITDPDSIVPVRRTRDGLAAIAVGRGDGWVEVKSAAGAAVRFGRGDMFVTSGSGGIFPPDIPVARVQRGATDTALGMTYAQPDTLDFAIVLKAFIEPVAPPPAAAGGEPTPADATTASPPPTTTTP